MPVEFKDYYQTLGVSSDASADEIKKAFRRLARAHHPDHAQPEDRQNAEDRFKEINEAYDVLGDPEKRRKYDQLGANWEQYDPTRGGRGTASPDDFGGGFRGYRTGPGGYEFHFGGTGFSDFFEQFFGGAGVDPFGDTMRGGRSTKPPRGHDLEAEIQVQLHEAYLGAERTIRLERVDPQSGERKEQSYKVKIPAGVKSGQRIRLSGQGDSAGGFPGDLFLKVRIAPHPDYEVKGSTLNYALELPAWDAALGASREIPLPGGKRVRINIPAGAKSGDRVRLRGLGLPAKGGPGDLIVEYTIIAPRPKSDRERRLWEELRDRE